MKKQLNLTDLMAAIKHRIEHDTDLTCYDVVPDDQPAPFVFCELRGTAPSDTKTMNCTTYTVWLHVIAEEQKSSIPIFHHIEHVQEAMTKDVILPRGVRLILQTDEGILTIKTDESGEKHAVLQYAFKVAFGFKTKNNYGFDIYQ